MIVAVNGYNGKKNKATMTTACLAGMSVMTMNAKTLVIQLLDADISSVEQMLNGRATIAERNTRQITFSEEGIDALFRTVDSNKIIRDDFNQFCTPMMQTENLLDVTAISKNKRFTETLATKMENLKNILESAQDIYDNIFLLVSPREEEAVKAVNEMADQSIYCLTQGHLEKGNVYGRNISFVVTDFDPESMFSLKSAKKVFCTKKERIFKINRNTGCIDSSHNGTLLSYIKKNREVDVEDINFIWYDDLRKILDDVLYGEGTEGKKVTETLKKRKEEVRTYKECDRLKEKEEKFELAGYEEPTEEKQSFFSRIFRRNKKQMLSMPRPTIEQKDRKENVSELPEKLEAELEKTLSEEIKNNISMEDSVKKEEELKEADGWEEIEEQAAAEPEENEEQIEAEPEENQKPEEVPLTAETIKLLIQEALKDMVNAPEPQKRTSKKTPVKRTTASKEQKVSTKATAEKTTSKKAVTKAAKEETVDGVEENQTPKKTTTKRVTKKADDATEETAQGKKAPVKKAPAKKVSKEVVEEVTEEKEVKPTAKKTAVKKETAAKTTSTTRAKKATTAKTATSAKTSAVKSEVEAKEPPKKTATRTKKATADKTE